MNKKNNLNLQKIFYLLFFITIILFFIDLIIHSSKPFEEIELDLRVEVNQNIGIVINDSIIDFGILPAGLNSNKKVILYNDFNYPVRVKVFVKGNISDYIFGESEVFLLSNSQEVYNIELYLPSDMEKSIYTGNILFKFHKL
ncbi:MAG: hypothetical protein WDA47_03065 [Bacilli bacterium]